MIALVGGGQAASIAELAEQLAALVKTNTVLAGKLTVLERMVEHGRAAQAPVPYTGQLAYWKLVHSTVEFHSTMEFSYTGRSSGYLTVLRQLLLASVDHDRMVKAVEVNTDQK